MKFSKSFDIAVRSLVAMAERNTRVNSKLLSDELKVSYHHTAKVLQLLQREGFIRTVKGKGGGVELISPPSDIKVQDILNSVEGRSKLMDCTIDKGHCHLSATCLLRMKILEAEHQVNTIFGSTTIDDLIPGRP